MLPFAPFLPCSFQLRFVRKAILSLPKANQVSKNQNTTRLEVSWYSHLENLDPI